MHSYIAKKLQAFAMLSLSSTVQAQYKLLLLLYSVRMYILQNKSKLTISADGDVWVKEGKYMTYVVT